MCSSDLDKLRKNILNEIRDFFTNTNNDDQSELKFIKLNESPRKQQTSPVRSYNVEMENSTMWLKAKRQYVAIGRS